MRAGQLAGEAGERTLLIWNGRMSAPVAAVLAHLAHANGCRVLPTPLAANELGCQAAGLGGTHARAGAGGGRRREACARSCCWAPIRSAAGRAASAGAG